ncbi:toll/interleukin-1 receptor domain-containing protein [Amphibiibacter pelophylacis]|uniref:Toll/interleukin-1 receptor domain-containing protein n=1 Tax=Amphibiibacter pelophylacis TaxID=1799477 RepID=A0ACC6NZK7_9BURK
MTTPRAFVSYSHDSQTHKKWVLEFAIRLRNCGIDAILDQWDLRPGDDIPHFVERNLASADKVLMICTDEYVAKANSGTGGVGYEKMIVTSNMMQSIDSNKVIPIIRQPGTRNVPTFLKTKLYIDFSREDQAEFSFDELVRCLVNAPLFQKPPIGNTPFKPVSETPVERSADAVLDLMRFVVSDFESHAYEFVLYKDVVKGVDMSRILLDMAIKQAKAQGLVTLDGAGDLYLTDKGKLFAVNHNLTR